MKLKTQKSKAIIVEYSYYVPIVAQLDHGMEVTPCSRPEMDGGLLWADQKVRFP
jgi:hypothetical protein